MNDEALALHADPARAFDGQYQLGAEIGAGALGVVYRGVDERLDKPVAIKVWHSRLEEAAALREQYDAEARALTALDHPNVVAITDYGIAGEAPYLVMELLEGQTLEARMRAGALPSALTQTFMQSVLRGLGYMHMRGVMHRNLKPDNVFLHKLDADSEQLKLLDLRLESLPANSNAGPTQSVRTAYDPPESDAGTEPDGRSDVYAAGVMMLHMLSGREPTRELVRAAADSADLLEKLLPTATPEVRAFIARAVATERGNRFGNADQMLRALLELGTPWAGDPPGAVAAQPARAASLRPQSVPAHAEPEPAADVGLLGDTVELPPPDENELIGAKAAPVDEEVVLGPIGLMAKLRTHKRLLLLAGSVLTLAAAGGAAALVFQGSPAAEHAELGDAKGKGKPAKAPAEEEGEDDEEAEPVIKRAEPGAEQAGAPKFAARLSDGSEPKAPLLEEKPTVDASAPAKPGAEHEAPTLAPEAPPAAVVAPAPETKLQPSAADETSKSLPAPIEHGASAVPSAHSAAAQPTAATSGKVETPEVAAPPAPAPASAQGATPTAAASGEAVAAQAEPAAPTPEQIGSERHIEPDKDEIRQMLALAIAPKPRVAAKNPWNIEVPDSLQALRDAIAKGEPGSAGNLKALRRYNSANPEDVYGHLLLAGFYANRGYSLDALDQYDMAYRIDSSSRGAPEMLQHALTMVARGIADTDAARFIDRVYGREALGAIAQRAAARDTGSAGSRRLKQLQTRISTGKRR